VGRTYKDQKDSNPKKGSKVKPKKKGFHGKSREKYPEEDLFEKFTNKR